MGGKKKNSRFPKVVRLVINFFFIIVGFFFSSFFFSEKCLSII